jgi:hypothetical protein
MDHPFSEVDLNNTNLELGWESGKGYYLYWRENGVRHTCHDLPEGLANAFRNYIVYEGYTKILKTVDL